MYVGCEQISVHASGGEPLGICERSSSSRCKPGTSSSRRLRVGRGRWRGKSRVMRVREQLQMNSSGE